MADEELVPKLNSGFNNHFDAICLMQNAMVQIDKTRVGFRSDDSLVDYDCTLKRLT